MTEPVIAVEALEKSYGSVRAVDAISFEVAEGEIFGVVGPNGAGKTTTIECLEGLRAPDGGRVHVLGLDPRRDGDVLRQRIGAQAPGERPGVAVSFVAELGLALWLLVKGVEVVDSGAKLAGAQRGTDPQVAGARA